MNRLLFLGIFISVVSYSCKAKNDSNLLKLWYNKPASTWEEALPIGNGRLGAMVFGIVEEDHIQLNEETVWAGEPGDNIPEGFNEVLPEVRKLIFAGKFKEAEDLAMTKIPRNAPANNNYGMPYQTVGDLWIDFHGHDSVTNYYRELDIQNAISKVQYKLNGVTYNREYLVSAPDQIIAVRLTASQKGKITCTLRFSSPQKNQLVAEAGKLFLKGTSGSADNKTGKVKFEAIACPILEGGKFELTDSSLVITGADAATIYLSIGTNFKNYHDISGDESAIALSYLNKAVSRDFDAIRNDHMKEYRNYFDRVNLDLGTTDSIQNPTDKRIADFGEGNDPQLVSLYFQFGRYLLISSSRPGTQPATLQGIWNYQMKPPWDSKYTVNINTEMNYWPAESTNLSEMHQPLFSMLEDLSVTGQKTALEMYGARGWAMHHNTDLWRITGPVDGAFYGMWPMGGAWLSQHLWQHYLFTGDKEFLQKVYPILKGVSTFYVDVLQTEPTHQWLVVAPCMSPENKHPFGTSMAAGNTMDNQLVFDSFSNLVNASQALNTDKEFADTVRTMIDRLPPMQIGQYNQLQEWLFDWDRPNDAHRHVSHLYGLFPSNQISPFSQPNLFQAARNSLVYRGDKSTGWSMGWKVNLWARLLDGNRAYKLIKDQLIPAPVEKNGQHGGTYPNLFDAHPPFQIDGNFGCTSGIAEMLMQSQDGDIFLLPALPDNWSIGSVKGLVSRGGFTIDMSWKEGKVETLTIYSSIGGNCRLRVCSPMNGDVALKEVKEGTVNTNSLFHTAKVANPLISEKAKLEGLTLPKTILYDFDAKPNTTYHLVGKF